MRTKHHGYINSEALSTNRENGRNRKILTFDALSRLPMVAERDSRYLFAH